ncbi:hypothetical protein EI42_03035 [Thermosporothrix hazakensis]|jgi:hypothetical protein|uniref:Uncharacterized protein n=2 Tax=Thermosporothrix TaxID=768650 RepID=A0A326UFC4_THEHA|nr:hypothetical protein [Thermosporothrix hazakensis]PZW29313.1 hypothetical protein EI42_03035 [Thermosporothrix hazakensis]BBH86242.1 hypothetical protein KTC_09930 [Thermosporothrix sp. COM3]GCE45336.1 hypothetical protein KTH_02050 [Thermosporothrix hazakensis]
MEEQVPISKALLCWVSVGWIGLLISFRHILPQKPAWMLSLAVKKKEAAAVWLTS